MSGTRRSSRSSRRFGNTAGRMDLRRLQEIAARYGLDVIFIVDQKDDERVPRDTPVIVSQFTRGVGTENIAQYRTTSVGYLKAHGGFAANPEHVSLDFKGGYRISDSHFADWHFFLEGKPSHPDDEPRTPWARLGAYEWTRDGRRVRHTEAYALAQAMQDAATNQHSSRHAMAAGEPAARRRKASPSRPKAPPSSRAAPTLSAAQALITALQARQGTVIDGGVRIVGPNRFTSYMDTLMKAVAAAGGGRESAERELRRGEIEVVSEMPGLGRKHAIVEYVVHPGLVL